MDCWPLAKNLPNQSGICHERDVRSVHCNSLLDRIHKAWPFYKPWPLWRLIEGFKAGSDTDSGSVGRPRPVGARVVILLVTILPPLGGRSNWPMKGSYLVDPASSHMLVSKIKPCMSKYKQLYGETANGSLNQL